MLQEAGGGPGGLRWRLREGRHKRDSAETKVGALRPHSLARGVVGGGTRPERLAGTGKVALPGEKMGWVGGFALRSGLAWVSTGSRATVREGPRGWGPCLLAPRGRGR